MIFRYAIDPSLFNDWEKCRTWMPWFQPDSGRLLARYPHDWGLRVQIKKSVRPVDRKRLIEWLAKHTHMVPATQQPEYSAHETWADNALRQKRRLAFQAIVGRPPLPTGVLSESDVLDETEAHPLFQAPTSCQIKRTANELVATIAPLLAIAKHIVFVDPYFTLGSQRWQPWLRQTLRFLAGGVADESSCSPCPGPKEVDVLGFYHDEMEPDPAWCQTQVERLYGDTLRRCPNVTLRVSRLSGLPDGETVHNRYVLTDVGGVAVQRGLDVADDENCTETDDISRLSPDHNLRRFSQYTHNRDNRHNLIKLLAEVRGGA